MEMFLLENLFYLMHIGIRIKTLKKFRGNRIKTDWDLHF